MTTDEAMTDEEAGAPNQGDIEAIRRMLQLWMFGTERPSDFAIRILATLRARGWALRAEVIEECAKVADGYFGAAGSRSAMETASEIAESIRSLPPKPHGEG